MAFIRYGTYGLVVGDNVVLERYKSAIDVALRHGGAWVGLSSRVDGTDIGKIWVAPGIPIMLGFDEWNSRVKVVPSVDGGELVDIAGDASEDT